MAELNPDANSEVPATPEDDGDRIPTVPSHAAMVVLPSVIAGSLNAALVFAAGGNPIRMLVAGLAMAAIMWWWMNGRRQRRVAEVAEITRQIEEFGTRSAPVGGWANPTRRQKLERWFDRNRRYRRR